MTTIKDIAQKAGVSSATVSYALNGTAQISDKTKKKIMKIAKEMNYKPNSIAKSLRTNSTKIIGVVVEDITSFQTPEIIHGINEYAEQKGFHMILDNLGLIKKLGRNFSAVLKYKDRINEVIDILLSKQVEGIIYVGHHTRDVSNIIKDVDKTIVYTYCYNTNESSDYSINYNDKLAAYEATEYLINFGHENIGVISGQVDSFPAHKRLIGYQEALMNNDLIFNPAYTKIGDWSYESGYLKMKDFLSNSNLPTAILAMNDLMAVGAIDAAREKGIKVPEELSVIGFDNREFSSYYEPKLTTIDLPLNEMGKESAKTLINIIDNKQVQPTNLKCELVERNSVSKSLII